jgi:N-acetylglutamate synthase-like GNAT family acetyltransferase
VSGEPTIRRELRPGDLGRIIAHHGETYLPEHELDSTFEAHVAASVAAAGKRAFPGPREGIWIVEVDGRHAGSIALTDEGNRVGVLRWVVLDRSLRGRGLGRRLIGEVLETAESLGYETLELETFSELRAAAHLYRSFGFELVSEDAAPRWGRERITYQRYELSFQARAQSSSSPRTGSSERPFSVSA